MARIGHHGKARRREQFRIALDAGEGEIARQQHALHVLGDAGIVVERHAGFAAARDQARVTRGDEFADGLRQRHAGTQAGRQIGNVIERADG